MYKSTSMRVLAFVLALVMSFSAVQPAAAFAVETEPVTVETEPVVETTAAGTEAPVIAETEAAPSEETLPVAETTAPAVETESSEEVTVPETEAAEEETVPATEEAEEETTPATEETIAEEEMDEAAAEDAEEVPESSFGEVTNYADFLKYLKELEVYAEAYAATSSKYKDATLLVINFIRTGVDRYLDDNWTTLAGQEITEFTEYVKAQAAANNSDVLRLRNIVIEDFKLPNGNQTDFGHMFGTMNISYIAAVSTADLGGWAGDICDLILYSKHYGSVPAGTIDEMAAHILEKCFGVDADDAFGWDDFYGDMDAFYLSKKVKEGGKLSEIMEAYFTASLSDGDRGAYFLNNRFKGLKTKEDVRKAVHEAYASNIGLQVLEAKRGIAEETDLRKASCYAFADYLFSKAGDRLEGDSGGDEPTTPSEPEEDPADNEYYTVFSSASSVLAPGIEQTIKYATTVDGKQIVYYVATVDVTRDDVTIMANYRNNDPSQGWGMQRVEDQANALLANHTNPDDPDKYIENFSVVVATNADGYNMSTGQPGGLLVMEGKEWHPVDGDGFFAILKDGTAMIGTKADYATYKDQIQEAVGGFGATLIKDGEIAINKSSSYYTTRASRTAIGITAEGKVVMMVLDGRQEPFSAGGSMEEIAQIMLEAGCVHAVNLDGGGSTTYLSKSEGSDTLKLINKPSDGYARSVATSLAAVSTAKSSKEFDHANLSSEYDYLTIGTELQITATGVSNTGNAAPIPEGATWKVSDETIGSITETGLFTGLDIGDVEVQLVLGEEILASKTMHVVWGDEIAFENASMNVVCGVPTELPVIVRYKGNEVAYNENDILLFTEHEEAGVCEGLFLTANEDCDIRVETVYALLLLEESELIATMKVTLYKSDEAIFDFDNATHGNRQFAWSREITNATTYDDVLFHAVDVEQPMDLTYTFALDMSQIEIPEQLKDITFMLPGADTGATAWDFLLQLAERVSILTEVRVTAQFDPKLNVDISNLTVANDYFYKKSASLDENNALTLICGWYDQTKAIDAATANPICILSGIKATPKDDSWDAKNQVAITNVGTVSYKIYLRASSLYSFALSPANQQKYGLQPYSSEEVQYNGGPERGAYFGTDYASFTDSFTMDKGYYQGWYRHGDYYYYYVDNVPVTGTQYIPSVDDPTVYLAYSFEEDGSCGGTITGMFEIDGKKYYAIQGEKVYGWRSVFDVNGNSAFYYFDPYAKGAAVNGACKVEGYNYVFEDYKCVKGEIVKDSKGIHYRFAGNWVMNQWVEVDGNYYFARYMTGGYFVTDGMHSVRMLDGSKNAYHIFDENGVWQKDYDGLYDVGDKTYLIKGGIRQSEPGLVFIDGYYYYFCANDTAIKNRTYWPTKTNGLLPVGPYQFDELGRIVNPPVVEPEQPDDPTDPSDPVEPSDPVDPSEPTEPEDPKPVKDGVVKENGALYYYEDGTIQYCAGLVQLEDGSFIYVRSNGQLAIGQYWITNTNGLMGQGMHNFDENGKMTDAPSTEPEQPEEPDTPDTPDTPDEPEKPEVKNGIVKENGVLYYYINGVRAYCAGLVKLEDGSYIYVRSNGQLAIGLYWVTNDNGLLPQRAYTFGEDGKMLNPPVVEPEDPDTPDTPDTPDEPDTPVEPEQPAVKNGIVDVNGVLYYYENDVIKYGAGVVQLTDDSGATFYIYVRSNGQLALGNYWPTTTNGLIPGNRCYNFGTDGRLYL